MSKVWSLWASQLVCGKRTGWRRASCFMSSLFIFYLDRRKKQAGSEVSSLILSLRGWEEYLNFQIIFQDNFLLVNKKTTLFFVSRYSLSLGGEPGIRASFFSFSEIPPPPPPTSPQQTTLPTSLTNSEVAARNLTNERKTPFFYGSCLKGKCHKFLFWDFLRYPVFGLYC